jgi:hypothetical protein
MLLLAISCGAQSKTDTPPPKAPGTQIREKIAAEFLDNIVKKDYEAARKDFAKTLMDAMSTEHIREKWQGFNSKIGAFQKVEYTREEKVGDNLQVKKRCVFTDQNMSIILVFNEENQVIGVWYKY